MASKSQALLIDPIHLLIMFSEFLAKEFNTETSVEEKFLNIVYIYVLRSRDWGALLNAELGQGTLLMSAVE